MKYLILIHHNAETREAWQHLSEPERLERIAAHTKLVEDLSASGELVMSEALADPVHATRVTVTDGVTTTTDGPFAELKEHLAGVYLVECDAQARAVELAARIPEAAFGVVEVRPIRGRAGVEM